MNYLYCSLQKDYQMKADPSRLRSLISVTILLIGLSNISIGFAQSQLDGGLASVGEKNELIIQLPLVPRGSSQTQAASSPLRSLAFSNMSSRALGIQLEQSDSGALLIHETKNGIAVQPIESPADPVFATESGLLIWVDGGREHWKYHTAPSEQEGPITGVATLEEGERSSRAISHPLGSLTSTNSLQQLAGLSLVRGSPNSVSLNSSRPAVDFVSPLPGVECLNPNIVIRRTTDSTNTLPQIEMKLVRGSLGQDIGKVLFAFMFPEGNNTLLWSDIPELPVELSDGLPAGIYSIVAEDNRGLIDGFKVGDADFHAGFSSYFDGLVSEQLKLPPALATLVKVEALLGFKDEIGKPAPYLCDALDAIERLDADEIGPGLELIRKSIQAETSNAGKQAADPYATGIVAVDRARQQIAQGRWSAASTTLKLSAGKSKREAGLVRLYQATIAGESGLTQFANADKTYLEAISLLSDEAPVDSWRAYNNYGVLLLNTAQDLLNNHSLQIASGVRSPLSAALIKWEQANQMFQNAAFLAEQVDEATLVNVQVNQARSNAVMADLLATFSLANEADIQRQKRLVDFSREKAIHFASEVANSDGPDLIARGAASEILAQLSFRAGDLTKCSQQCDAALQHFVDAGSLAGAESVLRLKGLADLSADESMHEQGLMLLTLSHDLSDILYQRIPQDETGRARAGFFSRRAYVSERIVEELIDTGKYKEALNFAEKSKSRSLKEVLATRQLNRKRLRDFETPSEQQIAEVVSTLDDGIVVLEYFLTADHAYAFLITRDSVRAKQLTLGDGTPMPSQLLVRNVIQLQSSMGHQARRMLKRIKLGKGLDHQWQHDLHELYQQLIPADFAETIQNADHIVIVPHHVLHYVPFAALVTALDEDPNASDRPKRYEGQFYGGIAQPKFLIDGGMSISIAPSLVSWHLLRQQDRQMEQASAIGITDFAYAKSLPGVEEDLNNFKSIFGDQVREILSGDDATEGRVQEMLDHHGVLLIATHGSNVADDPLASFMLTNRTDKSDGLLTALEIFQRPVKSDLIVMSACYTGLADRSPLPGDDLFGLQRAFLFSGSRAVVSGLWDVYDGTGPELMNDFFSRLKQGDSATQSLADTQRAFINKRRESEQLEFFLHPYFWSVYNVAGNGSIQFQPE